MPFVLQNIGPVGSDLTFDPLTIAWVAAVIVNGGAVSAQRQELVDQLVRGLRTDALVTKLDRLWLFAGEDEPSALTDVIATDLATTVNTPTFTADRGYRGNGSTMYINTNFNPTVDGRNFVQNSASIGLHMTIGNLIDLGLGGAIDGVKSSTLIAFSGGGAAGGDINDNGSVDLAGSTNHAGFKVLTRTASGARAFYELGAVTSSDALASNGIPNLNMFVIARDVNAAASGFTDAQIGVALFGGGFTAAENVKLYNRIRTYTNAVGAT